MPIEAWGLVLNAVGAILVAYGQSRIGSVIYFWLRAHELFNRSFSERGNDTIIHITGVDDRMERELRWNRWIAVVGWSLFIAGVLLQLVPFVHALFKTTHDAVALWG